MDAFINKEPLELYCEGECVSFIIDNIIPKGSGKLIIKGSNEIGFLSDISAEVEVSGDSIETLSIFIHESY
jgi:hypothetical protein